MVIRYSVRSWGTVLKAEVTMSWMRLPVLYRRPAIATGAGPCRWCLGVHTIIDHNVDRAAITHACTANVSEEASVCVSLNETTLTLRAAHDVRLSYSIYPTRIEKWSHATQVAGIGPIAVNP